MPTKRQKQAKRKPRTTFGSGSTKAANISDVTTHTTLSMRRPVTAVFPDRLRRTLSYCDAYQLVSTVGSLATQKFKVNSLYDPDLTGTGHQPRGFDQLCSATGPYTRYRVLKARVGIEYIGDAAALMVVAAGFADTTTLPATASGGLALCANYGELPGWRTSLVPALYGAITEKNCMAFQADINDIGNRSKANLMGNNDYASVYNGDPSELAYFHVLAQCFGTGSQNMDLLVRIEFDVQFEDPLLLAAS